MLSEVETLLHADKNLAFRCVAFINITYFISIFIKKFKTKKSVFGTLCRRRLLKIRFKVDAILQPFYIIERKIKLLLYDIKRLWLVLLVSLLLFILAGIDIAKMKTKFHCVFMQWKKAIYFH